MGVIFVCKMLARSSTRFAASYLRCFCTNTTSVLQGEALVNSDNEKISREDFFKDKKVVLFGVPGAFTPVCSQKHVPSYLENVAELKSKGVDTIACVSVNDPFVMKAWAETCNAKPEDVVFLADWNASFVKELGLSVDLSAANLGERSKRFSMIVNNGKVVAKNVEVSPGDFEITSADKIIAELDAAAANKNDSDSN